LLHPSDLIRGYADHVIGLLVANCRSGAVWPAQRGDGTLDASYPLIEGQWCRFAANATMPNNLSPMGEVIWRTVQKYGMILCDKTSACLAMRANPDCAPLLTPSSSIDGRDWSSWAFTNFPWSDLKLLAVGSDADFHPTT
jgi:hypothetical protein